MTFHRTVVFDDGELDEVQSAGDPHDPLARSSGSDISKGIRNIKAMTTELFEVLANAIFACAGDLEELSIFGLYHLDDIGYALSRATQTLRAPLPDDHASLVATPSSSSHQAIAQEPITFPHLTTFSSVLSRAHGAIPFLTESCIAVRRWNVTRRNAVAGAGYMTDGLFPLLDTYEGTVVNLKSILCARPVHNVTITHHIDSTLLLDLMLELRSSQVQLTRLSLMWTLSSRLMGIRREGVVHYVAEEEWLLFWLARTTRSLRYLELSTDREFRKENFSEERMIGFARGLAELQMLEELIWHDSRGTAWGEAFPKVCFESAPVLRTVNTNKTVYQRDSYV